MSVTTTPITVAGNYFGELGWMVEMGPNAQVDPHSMRVERPTTLRTSIGGFTVGIASPRSHREWSVDVPPCEPSELAPVLAYIDGEFGQGPWWWVPEDAARANLLPPRAGVLDPDTYPWVNGTGVAATPGGPVRLAPDNTIAGRSYLLPTGWSMLRDREDTGPLKLPVVPGQSMTFSAWLSSPSMTLRIQVRDSDNAIVNTVTAPGPADATTDALVRGSVTVPNLAARANHVVIAVQGSSERFARPAVTWTNTMVDYGAARGCPYAIISADQVDQNVDILLDGTCCPPVPGRVPLMVSGSYTIREVA